MAGGGPVASDQPPGHLPHPGCIWPIWIRRLCPDGYYLPTLLVGINMDINNTTQQKSDEGMEVNPLDSETASLVGELSRVGSLSSIVEEMAATSGTIPKLKTKRKRKVSPRKDAPDEEQELEEITKIDPDMECLRKERSDLESFLFTESNKVNKIAIKYILNKWTTLEGKVQDLIIEKKKLEAKLTNVESLPVIAAAPMSYAQTVASTSYAQVGPSGVLPRQLGSREVPVTKRKENKISDVILIKPINDDDGRSSEEMKNSFTTQLEPLRGKLKIKGMRLTRQKGLLVEVNSKEDINIIRKGNLDKVGLKTEEPKKLNPSIIIYDVEKDHTPEVLKKDFVEKNLSYSNEEERLDLMGKVEFRHRFANKSGRYNWIVQLPGKSFTEIINQGRVFMVWRAYRLSEYINITRCYKCHGYGHVAKYCSAPEQLCEMCGSKEHLRENCPVKNEPKCVNCTRTRRTNTDHSVKSKNCPEYLRQLELYQRKIQWA